MELSEYDEPYESPVVDLIYNNDTDTTNIHHIMLISDSVSAHQIFVDSANANTFPIVYSYYSDSSNLLQLLLTKFTHIQRISFVFHDPINQQKTFLDEKPFFTDDDLILGKTTFSDNVTFLQNLISQFTVSNIDFLACNSLIYDNWKTYYQLLTDTTTVIVGASDNLSGNIKYGADWVMENTNTDIKTIYFNDIIDEFPVFLAVTTLSKNGGTIYIKQGTNNPEYSTDDQSNWIAMGNNSINIINTNANAVSGNVLTVLFQTDMTFNNAEQYFICGSEYITFDGGNNTITIDNVTSYFGLIQNGTRSANGKSNITVQNIDVSGSGTTWAYGWIGQGYFGKHSSNVSIDNCSSSGPIERGGICANGAGTGAGATLTITNCYSTGDIWSTAGGICGSLCGHYSGTVTITNCYSEGNISQDAGGICGYAPAKLNGTIDISNCYSKGEILGGNAGGMIGKYASDENGNITITNSYSEGTIGGGNCGGIVGAGSCWAGGTVTITNCYSKGDITGLDAGGIVGYSGGNQGTLTVSKCYSEGEISGKYAGGIGGGSFAYYTRKTVIINCYSKGKISGEKSGGIGGFRIGGRDPNGSTYPYLSITNSYSLGEITGSNAGGIAGSVSRDLDISNCYSLHASGNTTIESGGMVGVQENGNTNFSNTYGANGTWSNATANTFLLGYPTLQNNPGDTWAYYYYIQDTPYILSEFVVTIIQNAVILFKWESSTLSYSDNGQNWTNVTSFPIIIGSPNPGPTNVLFVEFTTDMTFTAVDQYFKCGSEYITFDGKDTTSTFTDIIGCLGLIQNGAGLIQNETGLIQNGTSGADGKSNITVKNINVASSGTTTMAESAGWVCHTWFGKGVSNVLIDNCSSLGDISLQGGGICGLAAGANGGTATITNCYSTGDMLSTAGGICGPVCGHNGTVTITNCYSEGNISQDAGGICGYAPARLNGTVVISNCYSKGELLGGNAGGIIGKHAGDDNGNITITNSYSEGTIGGTNCGGIVGASSCEAGGTVTITNCYSKGEITGLDAGGIVGFHGGIRGTLTVSKCYSEGEISGKYAGGIGGGSFGNYTRETVIINCYSKGKISGEKSGGIGGFRIGGRDPNGSTYPYLSITNSYSLGEITGSNAGGIAGSVYRALDIYNSYSLHASGNTTIESGGMVGVQEAEGGITNFYNTYGANGTWSSTDANSKLTGTPEITNPGDTWAYYYIQDTPYILTEFVTIIQNAVILFKWESSTLSYSTDNGQNWTNVTSFPIIIGSPNPGPTNVLSVEFTTDMTFTAVDQYFKCGCEYITFDGKDTTSTFSNVVNCLGLIQNGTSGADGKSNITVQNINVASSGTTLATSAGWVCQSYFGTGVSNVLIDNCSSLGDIGQDAGGIGGQGFVRNGTGDISNCHSLGDITGLQAGGIVGRNAAADSGNLTITNCYSEGKIYGVKSGGIFGAQSGNHPDSIVTAFNCYSKGEIFGQSSGGIYGFQAGKLSTATASQCYSEGKISGENAGGICGDQASRSEAHYATRTTIINCYSEGEISGKNAGGICGYRCGYDGTVIISNSYSKGAIGGVDAGGLCGSDAGMNNGSVTISNSYSLYASGDSNMASGGMIGPSASTGVTITNTYGANGTWSSTDANSKLTGTPEITNPGDTWAYYYIQDTPYILTVFITLTTLNYTIDSTSTGAQLDSIVFGINNPIINIPTIVTIDGNDYSVTTVNANLFKNNANVIKITIPDTVTSILGDDIFSGCSALTEVNIGLVTSLGSNTFKDCISLLNVILPDTLTSMGDNTFDGCISLEYVSLGSVTSIGDNTFNGCGELKRFNIPGTAEKLYSPNFFGINTLPGIKSRNGGGIFSGPMVFNFKLG